MYPPNITPPGIYPSADGLEVTAPISIVEWFTNFYTGNNTDDDDDTPSSEKPIEFIQRPGDLVYVPTGWWHIVLNLEECIAVTQNFCNHYNVDNVTRFIRKKGNTELMQGLGVGMKEKYPQVWEQVEQKQEEEKAKEAEKKVVFWEQLQQDHVEAPFSFNFGGDMSEDDSEEEND
jgi:ribosomal protein L16 Arg81 hydroxylase